MKRLTLMAVCIALSGLAFAQQRPGSVLERFWQGDRNGDGVVTREEFSGPERIFNRLDRDGDGKITREESQRLRPRGQQQQPQPVPDDVEALRDVEFGKGGETPLLMDIYRPKTRPGVAMPVVVWIHGGAWSGGDKRSGASQLIALARKGYFCTSINYRLSTQATFPAQIEDCKCAIRYLRAHAAEYNLDPGRIGVWGPSAGGHLVALLGTSGDVAELEGTGGWAKNSSRVQAVCDWYGPGNLVSIVNMHSRIDRTGRRWPGAKLIGGPLSEKRAVAVQASPVTYVSADDPPFLIMHGTEDPTVPYGQSVELKGALEKAGLTVELVPLEGAGHGGPQFQTPEVRRKVLNFFDRHLKGRN